MSVYNITNTSKINKRLPTIFFMFTLVVFILFQSNISAEAQTKKPERKVFTTVDQSAEFPGGMTAMRSYLAKNIRYPDAAKKSNIQGKVVLQFVVNYDGSISDVEIKHNLPGGCGEEARRVVMAMPKWKPGRMNGRAVNMYYTLPVSFVTK